MTTLTPRRGFSLILLALVTILVTAMAPAAAAPEDDRYRDDLAAIRRATAQYRDIDNAIADGYQLGYRGLVTHCVEHETDGAMGYHYFNWDLFDDPRTHPLRPEGLVYAPTASGELRLVAVEWVVPKSIWDESGGPGIPSVLGIDLHILNPVLNWYILHAWVWRYNPAGVFEDWNPAISCHNN